MKVILSFLILFPWSLFAVEFNLDSTVYENSSLEFTPHVGSGNFSNYIAMNVNYAPVKSLYESLQKQLNVTLKSRGEAHVTVITPVEYFKVLKSKISIEELNHLAKKEKLQESKFKVICLGRGEKKEEDQKIATYFLVVSSQELLDYREKVEELFLKRGGHPQSFKSSHYFPHVTVGFTHRDLHESDGVIKDVNSCYAGVNMIL